MREKTFACGIARLLIFIDVRVIISAISRVAKINCFILQPKSVFKTITLRRKKGGKNEKEIKEGNGPRYQRSGRYR